MTLIRDKVCVAPGAMNLYLTDAWIALPGHDSYGHDVEAAYLMLEAEEVLGKGHAPRTLAMARMLVDHALAYGWDGSRGGFYRDGGTYGPPEDRQKEWWVEAEGLNALLLMHDLYGATTDVYFRAFQKQWQFINDYQRDAEFHGLHEMIDGEGRPVAGGKGRIWKRGLSRRPRAAERHGTIAEAGAGRAVKQFAVGRIRYPVPSPVCAQHWSHLRPMPGVRGRDRGRVRVRVRVRVRGGTGGSVLGQEPDGGSEARAKRSLPGATGVLREAEEGRHTSLSAGSLKLFSATRTAIARTRSSLEHELEHGHGLALAPAHELGFGRRCD